MKTIKEYQTIKEYRQAFINNFKEIIEKYNTVFKLQQYMIKKGICPRCGRKADRGLNGINCYICGFKMTAWEVDQTIGFDGLTYNDNSGKKGYLKRRLKQKRKK